MCRGSGRRLWRSRTKDSSEPGNAFCFRGGCALSDVSCICTHGSCMGTDEVAVFTHCSWRMVVCHWDSPLLRQPLSAESEWDALAGHDHTPGRTSDSGWLDLYGVGSLEIMNVSAQPCSSRCNFWETAKEMCICKGGLRRWFLRRIHQYCFMKGEFAAAESTL